MLATTRLPVHQQVLKNLRLIFPPLLLLTSFFLLIEVNFCLQNNRAYFADFSFVAGQLHLPLAMLPAIFFFIAAQLLVHLCYALLLSMMSCQVAALFSLSPRQTLYLAIGCWLGGTFTVMIANQYYFPYSKFAELTSYFIFNQLLTHTLFLISLLACCLMGLLALCASCLQVWAVVRIVLSNAKRRKTYGWLWLSLIVLLSSSVGGWIFLRSGKELPKTVATIARPNIILIGIDSLRPDFLSYFGGAEQTAFFDTFLKQAIVFKRAMTPLARTFPAWVSILSGQYPYHSGVRFNLAQVKSLKVATLLPTLLQQQGYRTLYATDETRFSNIDTHFGFNTVVSPLMGLNDFLLGTFNDAPLSNLLINTVVGKYLFPYSYANRPVYFAYDPDSFLNKLKESLQQERQQPLFLAVHFCLPHYPYLWARMPVKASTSLARYRESIQRVDQQLHDFFTLLTSYQLLDHAIVVLLSDHGEAFELPGDRVTKRDAFVTGQAIASRHSIPDFYPPGLEKEAIDESVGHGTDVLSLSQYRTLLAFRLYGLPGKVTGHPVEPLVSLLDIKPTLLAYLRIPAEGVDGLSLLNWIQDSSYDAVPSLNRQTPIFLESDYSPPAIRTLYPETRTILLEGIQLFRLDPMSMRLIVKGAMGKMIIRSKQLAAIQDNWILALYPQNQTYRMPILVNLQTGQWTNDLSSVFAKHSPVVRLLASLKQLYGREITQLD